MTGCLDIASDRLRPSITSCRNCLLTSVGMPFDSKCVMLCNATVSGMPEFNKFANCCVNVANSCIFGLRLRDIHCCIEGGRNDLKLIFVPGARPGTVAAVAPAFAA